MEIKHFDLGTSENNLFIRIIKLIFGAACIGIGIFWFIFNTKSMKSDVTLWITIIFLFGFGFYQIWSGIGRATKFIEIGKAGIRIKKNVFLASVSLQADGIERIEIFPLSVIFHLKTRKKNLLRFGTTYHDVNEKILDEIIDFAGSNNIPFEVIEDKL
jgi:hypothetical protein